MDLYLHIGTAKTGTTSIQRFLDRNASRLNSAGAKILKLPGRQYNYALAALAMSEPRGNEPKRHFGLDTAKAIPAFRSRMAAALSAELEGATAPFAVFSNEHCSSRLRGEEDVRNLHDFLRPHFGRMIVVVYLRRQDEFLLSTYSTRVGARSTEPLKIPQNGHQLRRYDYWPLLTRWQRVFGRENILCRRFERASLKNGDVVDDFLDAIGVPGDAEFDRKPPQNTSLDAASLEFLRRANLQLGSDFRGRTRLMRILREMSDGPMLTLPEADLSRFMESMRESNEKVAREYFGGQQKDSDDPLFARRDPGRPRMEASSISVEAADRFAQKVWAAFHRLPANAAGRKPAGAGERLVGPEQPATAVGSGNDGECGSATAADCRAGTDSRR